MREKLGCALSKAITSNYEIPSMHVLQYSAERFHHHTYCVKVELSLGSPLVGMSLPRGWEVDHLVTWCSQNNLELNALT